MIYNINTRADWAVFTADYRGAKNLLEMEVAAVDPDTKECGVASFLPGVPWSEASPQPGLHVYTDEAYRLDNGMQYTTLAVVESQRVFPGATQRTKSIVELARVAGVAGGALAGGWGDIVFLDPCVWKGQIKKPTKVAQRFEYVVHQRNMANLSGKAKESYLVAIRKAKSKGRDFQFEVIDAVGILLFTIEGLGLKL